MSEKWYQNKYNNKNWITKKTDVIKKYDELDILAIYMDIFF